MTAGGVFHSLQDFFDPGQHPPTPLVRLPPALDPFPEEAGVRIYAKLAFLAPTLNLKWAPANRMLREAGAARRLVEASSGNMALALALQCRAFGFEGITSYVPADLAFVKKELLHLAGVEMVSCTEGPGEPTAVEKARIRGREPGMLNLGQYENPANPAAQAQFAARAVWEQLEGDLDVFCAGLGTTGTLVGARETFAALAPKVQVVGGLCAPGHAVPGVRSEQRLKEIRFDWRQGTHHVEVETRESYRWSLRLIRSGLLAGPSSGFALAALVRFLEGCRREPEAWEALKGPGGAVTAVFLCGDTPHLYVDKYSTILDAEDFAV